ncbi:MAG: hypothetical protein K0R90_1423, partial [Oscillospiraceae bacterium]|nr:hypothetical protein [Oscillospiraceae bacterium]
MGAFAKVLVSIGQAVSKKESRDVLLLVLFIPLFLIVAFASVFNGIFISKDNKEDIFNIVIAEFKKENHIENNLQSNTAKTMYYFMHDEMTQDKVTIKRYINDYFYDGSRFLDCGEIMRMAKRNLHDLTDDEMLVAVRYIDESDPIWIGGKYPMPFGTRIEKSYNPDKFYNGVSLYGKLHDKVIAIEDGEVVEVDEGGSM